MEIDESFQNVKLQFVDSEGVEIGEVYRVANSATVAKLANMVNTVLGKEGEARCPYSFFITNDLADERHEFSSGQAVVTTLADAVQASESLKAAYGLSEAGLGPDQAIETVLRVVFHPQSIFKVRPITRCTASMPGHKRAVLVTQFSPDGRHLASGSGDCSIRFWDLGTQMSEYCQENAHKNSVLTLTWAPNGSMLASTCLLGQIILWTMNDKKKWVQKSSPLIKKVGRSNVLIKSIAWKPLHLDGTCRFLAAASDDGTITIWDTVLSLPKISLSGHQKPVRALKWGGSDLIYSGDESGEIRVWRTVDGVMCRMMRLHTHWVNSFSLNTDYAIRTGAFDPMHLSTSSEIHSLSAEELQKRALIIYNVAKRNAPERLAACSDDNTLSLWRPEESNKPICARMTGHQQVVNDIKFSPNGLFIASASFDHSVKIWDGMTGKFLATLLGHIQEVYLVAWSCDSRMLVSSSRDSTLKLWTMDQIRGLLKPIEDLKEDISVTKKITAHNCKRRKVSHLKECLPGHADSVYALDWSPDGTVLASGGKDGIVKLWKS